MTRHGFFLWEGSQLWLHFEGRTFIYNKNEYLKTSVPKTSALQQSGLYKLEDNDRVLKSPMPGKVFKVNVSAGAQVKRGQTLVVLEAMKMEYSLKSPADCKVVSVRKAAGDLVALDEIILELEK